MGRQGVRGSEAEVTTDEDDDTVDPAIWPLLTAAMAKMPRDLSPDDDWAEAEPK